MPPFVTTTITVPATSRNLVDLATWKDDWGITGTQDDAFLLRAITRCSASAEQFCNRKFAAETLTETIYLDRDAYPYQEPGGVRALQLSRWPLASVSSVVQQDAGTNTTLVQSPSDDPDYVVLDPEGQLVRLDSFGNQMTWPALVYTIDYQAGYILPGQDPNGFPGADLLPSDIEDAVGRMVYTRWSERRRDPLIKAETVDGVGRTEFIVSTNADGGNLSPDVSDILLNYRVPVIG